MHDENIERMKEHFVTKDQVLEAYRVLASEGFRNPEDAEFLDTPEAKKAGEMYLDWYNRERISNGEDESPELALDRITLFLDAGFTGVEHLESTLALLEKLEEKISKPENFDRESDVLIRVRQAKERINNLLKNPQ